MLFCGIEKGEWSMNVERRRVVLIDFLVFNHIITPFGVERHPTNPASKTEVRIPYLYRTVPVGINPLIEKNIK